MTPRSISFVASCRPAWQRLWTSPAMRVWRGSLGRADSLRVARARGGNRRADAASGSALRSDRWSVLHQGMLYRAGDGGPLALSRAHEPRAARSPLAATGAAPWPG